MQNRIFLSPPFVGEPERLAALDALDSGYVAPCGPAVDRFEAALQSIAGRPAAAVSAGTAALDLVMHALGVSRGDVVISSSLTFIATIAPAAHRGASPVFVDSSPDSGVISPSLLEVALAAHPSAKCVVAADIYGQCCDYDALERICARFSVPLVIDAAESLGASCRSRPAGAAGAASIFSFNGNKIATTSGGGAVLAPSPDFTDRIRWLAQQAKEPAPWYEHRSLGFNYRLSNISAAIGCAQLSRLDSIIAAKRRIFGFYRSLLSPIATPFPCGDFTRSTRWLSVFILPSRDLRDALSAALAAADIESRPVWKPLHLQPVFANCPSFGGSVSQDLFERGICLPSGAGLSDADLRRIASVISSTLHLPPPS